MWGGDGVDVLEGCHIDPDLMLTPFYNQPQAPQERPGLRRGRVEAIINAHMSQKVHILVGGSRLNPDLVRRTLTSDLGLLERDQAIALSDLAYLCPKVAGQLDAFVARRGVEALDTAEAVLWEIQQVPHGCVIARFAKVRAMLLEGDFQESVDIVDKIWQHVDDLEFSRPLRTVLQILSVTASTMAQEGLGGLNIRCLDVHHLAFPVVARQVEAVHLRRCRLRFTRMVAISKCPISPFQKRLIWRYLDDLQESPWDAVALMQRSLPNSGLSGTEERVEDDIRFIDKESRIYAAWKRREHDDVDERVLQQLAQMETLLAEADDALVSASTRLENAASHLCRLFGHISRRPRESLVDAAMVFSELRRFGQRLESYLLEFVRTRGSGTAVNRVFPVVDTNAYLANVTADLDIIRGLRAPPQSVAPRAAEATAPAGRPVYAPAAQALATKNRLMHGGPEGEYRRCPETGRWVPIGAMAIVRPDVPPSGRIAGL